MALMDSIEIHPVFWIDPRPHIGVVPGGR